MNSHLLKKILHYFFILSSILFLLDFFFSKEITTEKIENITPKRELYYNAGGNSHLSYELKTNENHFTISKEFQSFSKINDSIAIHKSLLFNEINQYKLTNSEVEEIYSLRYFSGLVLPLIYFLLFLLKLKSNIKIDALLMIFQIILLFNWIYIIIN